MNQLSGSKCMGLRVCLLGWPSCFFKVNCWSFTSFEEGILDIYKSLVWSWNQVNVGLLWNKWNILGHTLSAKAVLPNNTKIEAVKNFSRYGNLEFFNPVKKVKSFLGCVNIYRGFLLNFAVVIRPLTALMRRLDKKLRTQCFRRPHISRNAWLLY